MHFRRPLALLHRRLKPNFGPPLTPLRCHLTHLRRPSPPSHHHLTPSNHYLPPLHRPLMPYRHH